MLTTVGCQAICDKYWITSHRDPQRGRVPSILRDWRTMYEQVIADRHFGQNLMLVDPLVYHMVPDPSTRTTQNWLCYCKENKR